MSLMSTIGKTGLVALVAVISSMTITAGGALAQDKMVEDSHRGIGLIAVPPKPGVKLDITIVGPRDGLDRVREALDLIYRESPYSRAQIETLKKAGEVVIVYDPGFSEKESSSLLVGAFLPDFFNKNSNKEEDKVFLAVITHYGIKWPPRELAGIIAHELVGHGMQHMGGRRETMRELDLECEAWLYEEAAYQDLRMNKKPKEMIEFRQQLEGFYCDDFKRYMRKQSPSQEHMWDVLNPDVPRLLAVFEDYLIELDRQGISQKSAAAAEKLRAAKSEKAFRDASPEEQFDIAVLFRDGLSVPQDHTQAAKWFRGAAEKGLAEAQFNLGVLYAKGRGVAKEAGQAASWFRQAATQGHVEAQVNLGFMSQRGQGVPQYYVEAARWYSKAAEQGDARGQNSLGYMYEAGLGVSRDYDAAARHCREAALQGLVMAQASLARMYSQGRGVPQDSTKAAMWYRRAGQQGHAGAQNSLGWAYLKELGVPRDYAQALTWFEMAAEQGHKLAFANLAHVHAKGFGAPKSYAKAAAWYRSGGTRPRAFPARAWHPVPEGVGSSEGLLPGCFVVPQGRRAGICPGSVQSWKQVQEGPRRAAGLRPNREMVWRGRRTGLCERAKRPWLHVRTGLGRSARLRGGRALVPQGGGARKQSSDQELGQAQTQISRCCSLDRNPTDLRIRMVTRFHSQWHRAGTIAGT